MQFDHAIAARDDARRRINDLVLERRTSRSSTPRGLARDDDLLAGRHDEHGDRRAVRARSRSAWRALRSASSATPSWRRRAQTALRSSAECSPAPALKTSASRPRSEVVIAATAPLTPRTNTSKRELRALVAGDRGALDLAQPGEPAEAEQAGAVVERVVELVGRDAGGEQVQQQPRVERARARRHRHAVQRREAHRRVDRAPVEHGASPSSRCRDGRRRAAGSASRAEDPRRLLARTTATLRPWKP